MTDVNEYKEMSKNVAEKFLFFRDYEYSVLYPKPTLAKTYFDWKFWTLIPVSIATVIWASLRTAQMFYFAEELSSQVWGLSGQNTKPIGIAAAILTVLAVEGGITVISAIKTAEFQTIKDESYNWYLATLVIVSLVAGIGQSLGLVQELGEGFLKGFSILLAVVMGIGATVAAWFAGEIIGVQISRFGSRRNKAKEDLAEAEKKYDIEVRKAFYRKEKEQKESSESSPEKKKKLGKYERSEKRTSQKSEKVLLIETEIEKWISEHFGEVPSFSQLSAELREKYPEQNFSSDGYISTVRRNYLAKNQERFEERQNEED